MCEFVFNGSPAGGTRLTFHRTDKKVLCRSSSSLLAPFEQRNGDSAILERGEKTIESFITAPYFPNIGKFSAWRRGTDGKKKKYTVFIIQHLFLFFFFYEEEEEERKKEGAPNDILSKQSSRVVEWTLLC